MPDEKTLERLLQLRDHRLILTGKMQQLQSDIFAVNQEIEMLMTQNNLTRLDVRVGVPVEREHG
jgi:hypothetical protein